MELPELWECPVYQDHRGLRELKGRRENTESEAKADHRDSVVHPDSRDDPERGVGRDEREAEERQVRRDRRARVDSLESPGYQD